MTPIPPLIASPSVDDETALRVCETLLACDGEKMRAALDTLLISRFAEADQSGSLF